MKNGDRRPETGCGMWDVDMGCEIWDLGCRIPQCHPEGIFQVVVASCDTAYEIRDSGRILEQPEMGYEM